MYLADCSFEMDTRAHHSWAAGIVVVHAGGDVFKSKRDDTSQTKQI